MKNFIDSVIPCADARPSGRTTRWQRRTGGTRPPAAASSPRVSIGMPVFNAQRYLAGAIESVLSQTYRDFELIIADNASTDETPAICRRYAAADPRVRYSRNPANVGGAENFNRVFRLAGGRYFKWLADDDLCEREFLARCVETLDERPEVVLCYPSTRVIDAEGNDLRVAQTPRFEEPHDVVARFAHFLNPVGIDHNPIFGLVRRAALIQTGLLGKHLCSDRCLVAQLALLGEFRELPQPLLVRRKHARNVGNSESDLAFFDPARSDRTMPPELRVLRRHLGSIRQCPHALAVKLRLAAAVARWALRKRSSILWQIRLALASRVRRPGAGGILQGRQVREGGGG